MNKVLSISACLVFLGGCGSSEPIFDVNIIPTPYQQQIIRAAVVVDEIEVQKITINRGNCKANMTVVLPYKLKFGQVLDTYVSLCQVKEVTFETSEGSQSFTFD